MLVGSQLGSHQSHCGGCQCLYVMTADTARYPAPPGINNTSPPLDSTPLERQEGGEGEPGGG